MANQHLKIRKGIRLTPQATPPTNPLEGDMYFDEVIGLRLRKNGVWQTAGGQGEVKVALVDRVSTTLPPTDATLIDGETVLDGYKVLFTNLTVGNDRVYLASVDGGGNITWDAQPDFAGQFDPTEADVVRVIHGNSYCLSQFIHHDGDWIWGQIDFCSGEATLGSPAETWATAYIDDLIGESFLITTNATGGDAIVAGTEKLLISADGGLEVSSGSGLSVTGGDLNVTGGLTQTKSIIGVSGLDVDVEGIGANGYVNLTASTYRGQMFTSVNAGNITQVKIAFGAISATGGTIKLDIYSTSGGFPDTVIGSSDSVNVTSLIAGGTSTPALNTFTFSAPVAIDATTQYFILVNTTNITGGNIGLSTNNSGPFYAGGDNWSGTSASGPWTEITGTETPFGVYVLAVGNANIRFNAATSGYVDIKAADITTDYTLTMPSAQASGSQALFNDGSGNLSWVTIATTLQDVYDNSAPATITTNSGQGDILIDGTEKVEVGAAGGLDVTGGLTQTKSTTQTSQDIETTAIISGASQTVTGGGLITFGQTVTPTVSGQITEIRHYTVQGGSLTGGTHTLDVYATSGGLPVGASIGTSDSIPYTSVQNGDWTIYTFSSPVAVTAGVEYAIVMSVDNHVGSYTLPRNNTNPYAGGQSFYTTDGGSSWTADATTDYLFQVDVASSQAALRINASTSGYIDFTVPDTVTDYQLKFPAAQGTSGQNLVNDGAGNLSWEDPVLGFNAWTVINSDTNATAYDDYGVETGSNPVTVTLPATPGNGARVRIIDRQGTFATNSCFIATTDLSTIEGITQPLEIDVAYVWAEFVYDAAANNWAIYGPLAKGESFTFQDIYDGEIATNPVLLTLNATQGDFSITGTERVRFTNSEGLRIRSNTPSGIVLEVENPGTDQTAVFTNTNAANINDVIEVSHAGNFQAYGISINATGSNGRGLEITTQDGLGQKITTGNGIGLDIVTNGVSAASMRFQNTAAGGPILDMLGSTSGTLGLKVPAIITDYDIVMPDAQGAAGSFLKNDGLGNLSWDTLDGDVSLQDAYATGSTITTDAGNGSVVIAGTEKVDITAAGGLSFNSFTGNWVSSPLLGFSGGNVEFEPDNEFILQSTVTAANSPYYDFYMDAGGGRYMELLMAMTTNTNEISMYTQKPGLQSRLGLRADIVGSEQAILQIGQTFIDLRPSGGNSQMVFDSPLLMTTNGSGVADANPTEDLSIKTGNKTAGTGNSGDITIETGASAGGTRGGIYIKDGSEGTIGHVWTSTDTVGGGSWQALPAPPSVSLQDAYDGGATITLAGGNTPIDITGPAGQTGDALKVTNNGTATSANGVRATATNGVAFRGTSSSFGIFIDVDGADEAARFDHAGTGFAAQINKTTAGGGLDINVVGGGQALDIRNTGTTGIDIFAWSSSASNPSSVITTLHANPSAAHISMRRADQGGEVGIRPNSATSNYTITLPATDGEVGDLLHNDDGTGTTSWKRAGWVTKTVSGAGPHSVVNYDEVFIDTSSAAAVITLPVATKGLRIRLIDDAGTWATNNVTVNGNGADTFDGVAGPLTLNVNGRIVELIGDTNNWRVVVLK